MWKALASMFFGGIITMGATQMMHVKDEVNKDQVEAMIVTNDSKLEKTIDTMDRKIDSLNLTMNEAVMLLKRNPKMRLSHHLAIRDGHR